MHYFVKLKIAIAAKACVHFFSLVNDTEINDKLFINFKIHLLSFNEAVIEKNRKLSNLFDRDVVDDCNNVVFDAFMRQNRLSVPHIRDVSYIPSSTTQ